MRSNCIDCGKPGQTISCNSCSNKISVCDQHLPDYFPISGKSENVCIDCTNAGMGGEGRWIATHCK